MVQAPIIDLTLARAGGRTDREQVARQIARPAKRSAFRHHPARCGRRPGGRSAAASPRVVRPAAFGKAPKWRFRPEIGQSLCAGRRPRSIFVLGGRVRSRRQLATWNEHPKANATSCDASWNAGPPRLTRAGRRGSEGTRYFSVARSTIDSCQRYETKTAYEARRIGSHRSSDNAAYLAAA